MIEYSEAEKSLISSISKHWLDVIHKVDINPPKLYDILAIEVFVENRMGSDVDALRKAVEAIHNSSPYRMTAEFDELCQFKEQ